VLAAYLNGYRDPSNLTGIRPGSVTNAGGSQAHNNMQPYLAVNFCIAMQGLFPSRN
jgi:microcystin-dependent protein